MKYDVIIVGAGAAGLMAAKVLSDAKKKVCILEARNYIGGRAHTIKEFGFSKPIETGAEFIHGNLNLTLSLLDEANINYYPAEGELWQVKNNSLCRREDFIEHADELTDKLKELKQDISIADFLKEYFQDEKYTTMKRSLQQYIEGYDAADINYASAFALREEWENEDDEQYRIEGGYAKLFAHINKSCASNDCDIYLSNIVKQVRHKASDAEVITEEGFSFFAKKIIVTVPVSLLACEDILFEPALPNITHAAKRIRYGDVVKIIFEFTHAFWETGEVRKARDLFFIFSEEKIPTWWSQLPDKTPMLCGWLAGPKANEIANTDDDTILKEALFSLSAIFDINVEILQQYIKASHIHNWITDKFCKGGYSYNTVNGEDAKAQMNTPINNTIFFAGEAYVKANATVDAALTSGKEVAEKILKLQPE